MKHTFASLTKRIVDFRNARDWKQFHNPKDVSLSLVLEATEVMEHFQWKNKEEFYDDAENPDKNDINYIKSLEDKFYNELKEIGKDKSRFLKVKNLIKFDEILPSSVPGLP